MASWKIWLLIILVVLAVITIINPKAFTGNIMIKEVQVNSSAAIAGLSANEIIKEVNGMPIKSLEDYSKALASLLVDDVEFKAVTKNGTFNYHGKSLDFKLSNRTLISVQGKAREAGLKEGMQLISINEFSLSDYNFSEIKTKVEPKTKITILTDKQEYVFLTMQDMGITIAVVPKTRLKTGLDLEGGARALVKPERKLTEQEMSSLLETVERRLNVYGITDVKVIEVRDALVGGNRYMLVELAGVTPTELQELVSKQGKFEAKISDAVVFVGGQNDITFVCRNDASCAYIKSCDSIGDAEACRFEFTVHLSEQAAKRHANITANLGENVSEGRRYLNETLNLYLDDKLVDSLFIDVDLKGKQATQISITGSGIGKTRQEAYEAAQENMKKLQVILITGSLPFKLEIAKLDSVSPLLGKEFTKNIFVAAIAVFFGVCLVLYIRYKKIALFIPVVITIVSEALLVLFVAALIKWNLDLASIAGIIAAIGTGVDDQVVIIDESRVGRQYNIKERIKRAFFIILSAFAVTAVAMLPLWWAGAGLLKGFAFTTLVGITIGILITRPAFAEILKAVVKE